MEQSLKERLVGAAVLVVLAAIFVPMVLDGPETPPAAAPTTVAAVPSGASTFRFDLAAPLPEAGASTPATRPAAPAPATAAPAPRPAAQVAASQPAPAPATKPTAKPATTAPRPAAAAGWAAQVGAFSSSAKAEEVNADLKAKGFKSFVMAHKDGKTTLYRVRVGPVATRDAAEALARKITAQTGQTARPVQHP